MHDVLIRGGKIVDGTGNPAFTGDVAIANGRIVGVANSSLWVRGIELDDIREATQRNNSSQEEASDEMESR